MTVSQITRHWSLSTRVLDKLSCIGTGVTGERWCTEWRGEKHSSQEGAIGQRSEVPRRGGDGVRSVV